MADIYIEGVIYRAYSTDLSIAFGSTGEFCLAEDIIQKIRECQEETLYIGVDSPGGDFFAGGAMANAVSAWLREDSSRTVSVFIGSMALSAAAYFLSSLPKERVDIYAHKNSVLMFHGVQTDCSGGAGVMKDTASSLEKCNASIKASLLARTNIPPATIQEWLEEGRQGWLSAEEAMDAGLVDSIIPAEANQICFSPTSHPIQQENAVMNIPYLQNLIRNLKNAGCNPKDPAPKDPAKENQDPTPAPHEPAPKDPAKENQAEEMETLKEAVRILQETVAELQEKLLAARAKEEEALEVANKLTAGLRNSDAKSPAAGSRTFQDALKEYRNAHPTVRYAEAYAAVAKANPALYHALFQN